MFFKKSFWIFIAGTLLTVNLYGQETQPVLPTPETRNLAEVTGLPVSPTALAISQASLLGTYFAAEEAAALPSYVPRETISGMTLMVIAYMLVWAAIFGYLLFMRARQSSQSREIEIIKDRVEKLEKHKD